MDKLDLFDNKQEVNEANLEDIQVYTEEDIPSFEDTDFKSEDYEYINKNENKEELIRQIKNLSPEVKAAEVFKLYNTNNRTYPIIGHEKRLLMRKLIRDAKKGKLDKYFIVD